MRAHRVLIALNLLVALCLAVTAGAYGYLRWQASRIDTVDIGKPATDGAAAGEPRRDEPLTILLVGSDSRKGLSAKDRKAFGTEAQAGAERSDVIMLVRLDRQAKTARAMSVPRDLWVPIAGTGEKGKINAAFAGGPSRLVATIREALGVRVDHYVQVDFKAFRGVVDALGGVDIPFTAPARDTMSGLSVRRAGCVHLDGDAALAYVRSRNYEQLRNGAWQKDLSADLGRIERQHGFLRHLASQADVPDTLGRVNKLISSVVTNLTVDEGFSVSEMAGLVLDFRDQGAAGLQMVQLPVDVGRAGGQSVVFLGDGADEAVAQLVGGVVPAPAPSPPSAPPGGAGKAPATTPTTAPAPSC